MNMSDHKASIQGVTTPPLRVCRPQNVCGTCFSYWQRQRVVVPTDLPLTNAYCPVRYGEGGLNFPCLKVNDLMDIEEESFPGLDLVLIEEYPVNLRTSYKCSGRPGCWDDK